MAKREYQHRTGRHHKHDVIAYQIRQSFAPGEITPEEANKIGYETAMRWTKGKHAFIVATHIDRAHIHNHIIYNSTNLACDKKYRDFLKSGKALQKVSDIVCIEHGLSVIDPRPYSDRERYQNQNFRPSDRDILRRNIDLAFEQNPSSFEELLEFLKAQDYEIKYGAHTAVKKKDSKRFLRLDSLGESYCEEKLRSFFDPNSQKRENERTPFRRDFSLVVDIQRIISQDKGERYERWAKKFNLKQTAKVLCFLKENNIRTMDELTKLADEASARFDAISGTIKAKEKRIEEITDLRKHIFNFAKTKAVYDQYRKSGYSQKFYEEHREELQLHKAAKEAFKKLNVKKLPTVAELNAEFQTLVTEKKKAYAEYHEAKEKMQAYTIAKQDIEAILNSEKTEKSQEKKKEEKQF